MRVCIARRSRQTRVCRCVYVYRAMNSCVPVVNTTKSDHRGHDKIESYTTPFALASCCPSSKTFHSRHAGLRLPKKVTTVSCSETSGPTSRVPTYKRSYTGIRRRCQQQTRAGQAHLTVGLSGPGAAPRSAISVPGCIVVVSTKAAKS